MAKSTDKTTVAAKADSPAEVAATVDQKNLMANSNAIFAADAGAGMEGATAESFAIPFLMVLQKGSPEVEEGSGAQVQGAKAGMLFENISRTLVDGKEGLVIIPCAYRRVFLHWSESKGFQGEILPEDVARRRQEGKIVEHKGKLYIPDATGKVDPDESDRISDTRNHYVLIIDRKTGGWRQALISLSSTQIKKSRALMTALASVKLDVNGQMITPPTFANLVRVTTVPESNDKGSWMGWHFELEGMVQNADVYAAAKQFHKSVAAGQVEQRAAVPQQVLADEKEGF